MIHDTCFGGEEIERRQHVFHAPLRPQLHVEADFTSLTAYSAVETKAVKALIDHLDWLCGKQDFMRRIL